MSLTTAHVSRRIPTGARAGRTHDQTEATLDHSSVMRRDIFMRGALWASVPLNLGAALLFAFPSSSVGQWAGLPPSAPPVYTAILAWFVVLFGGSYAWLACQSRIDRPLVALAAIGKTGVFVTIVVLWWTGDAPARGVVAATSDLALAAIYAWWILGQGG